MDTSLRATGEPRVRGCQSPRVSPAANEQVQSRAEAVDDPVEVSLALPVPIVGRQARIAAVFMPRERQVGQRDGTPRRRPLPLVAEDEAPPDIEVAVEPEALVERPARREVRATERKAIGLDCIDLARRRVLEPAQVAGHDPPSPGESDRRVLEGRRQRGHEVAGWLDARIERSRPAPGRGGGPRSGRRPAPVGRSSTRSRSPGRPFHRPPRPPRGRRPALGRGVRDETIDVPSGAWSARADSARARSSASRSRRARPCQADRGLLQAGRDVGAAP